MRRCSNADHAAGGRKCRPTCVMTTRSSKHGRNIGPTHMAIRTRARLARFVFIAGIAGTALVAYGSVRQFLTMYRPNVGMVGDIGVLGYGYLLPAIIALYLA